MLLRNTCIILFLVDLITADIKISPSTLEAEQYVNGSYVVTCHGDDTENTTWKGPEGNIISHRSGRVHIEDSMTYRGHHVVLVFERIERIDEGKYTCTTSVHGQLQQASFKLTVVRPISFFSHQSLQRLVEGQNALIRCEVLGEPHPIVTWLFHGRPIQTKNEYFNASEESRYTVMPRGLYIRNVSREDEGSYLCRAYQITQKTSNFESLPIYITVLQRPRWPDSWKSEHEVVYGYVGGVNNITCFAEGRPSPGYAWTRHNRTIDGNYGRVIQEENHSVLEIKIKGYRVFGDYECVADNGIGKIWKRFTLMEGRKPNPPQSVRLLHVTPRTAKFQIKSSNEREVLLGYRIEFLKVGRYNTNSWDHPEYQDFVNSLDGYKLVNLIPMVEYKYRVAAKSISGLSDFTHEFRFTTSGATQGLTSFVLIASSVILAFKYNL